MWKEIIVFAMALLAGEARFAHAGPVRVSRSFFSVPVEGRVRLNGVALRERAPIAWVEGPGGTDHPGCAFFDPKQSVGLCFELMNDVDSFGLNTTEMQPVGLEGLLQQAVGAPCTGVNWAVLLAAVSRTPSQGPSNQIRSFQVSYIAVPQSSECGARNEVIELDLARLSGVWNK